jgi:putative addiction module component (TIGR02574 family)
MGFKGVLELVRSLPFEEQRRLVDLIHDELLSESEVPDLTPEQIGEVKRRIAEYDANPSIAIPWQEFEAHIEKQLEELGE